MVHALQEARRVLKPDGVLMDLRPAPAHRRLGIGAGPSWRLVGSLHERLDDDHAADAAVADVVRRGLFRKEARRRFRLDRVMDTLEEARAFLAEFDERRDQPSHEPLLRRLERKYNQLRRPGKVAIRGPMHLTLLRKLPSVLERGRIGAHMIVAILPSASSAETLLNNLSEADFDLNNVSVIMQDVSVRNKIAKDVGPLKGVQASLLATSLKTAGVAQDATKRCNEAIKSGKVVVAMQVDPKYQAAAREMFTDASAEIVHE